MRIKKNLKRLLPNKMKLAIKKMLYKNFNQRMIQKHKKLKRMERGIGGKMKYPCGINLIGDIQAETGLGQSMRILAHILEANQIPFVILQVDQPGGLAHNEHSWDRKIAENAVYSTNLIHINASDWADFYVKADNEVLMYRKNIAYWLWELEEFPQQWRPCIETVDAIWTPSDFIRDCLRQYTQKEVVTIPYSIQLAEPVSYGRAHFRLPEEMFLYLMMYDFHSVSERKNPKGVINAFQQAFTPQQTREEQIGLVIKVNHASDKEMESLKKELTGYENVYYITDNLTRAEVESLVADVDVLLSLHRSEGFGLPAAEAMYLGTPVIATNWSATTEFMSQENSCLVDYQMITLEKDIGPYAKGSRWADANLAQAADYMQKLCRDHDYYEEKKQKARTTIREQLNDERVGRMIDKMYK